MDEKICSICGDDLDTEYCHTLDCKHTFHYNCLFQSFKSMKNLDCPYCRSKHNKLPLVNGIKKIHNNIHDLSNIDNFENKMCVAVLQRGKNKGSSCGKNCFLGYEYCKIHLKKYIKGEGVNNNEQ